MSQFTYFDHLFDPVLVLNEQAEIIYFNNQSSVFFKLSPRLLRQKGSIATLIGSEESQIIEWINSALQQQEVLVSAELKLKPAADPENINHVIIKCIPMDDNCHALVFHDVTVERNLHLKYREKLEELKKTHNQILQADKLATIGELTANISHEINNPLTIAAGNSEIIRDFLKLADPMKKIDTIRLANKTVSESLERVDQIIKNMRDFLHQSEDKKEYCDLGQVVNAAIEWIGPSLQKSNVQIKHENHEGKYIALANKIKLEQVMINLIKNSIDAMSEVDTKDKSILIQINKSDSDQQIHIDVIDNGPGIAAEMEENLFKPFMSTKDEGRGSGLGLSICAKIIESHQGTLEHIASTSGCHFRIGLPLIEVYSYTRNDKYLSGHKKEKRILVLDNEVQILNVLNSFIQDEGLVFIGSSDPGDALDFLTKASVDLVITDFSMPAMSGNEFVTKARAQAYQGPVLYMTSAKYVEQFNRDKKDLGISGLLLKPFNKDEVMKAIHLALKDEAIEA
jgi:signal transduction histidine kinase/CheY-like chemotaxis protein